MAGGIWVISPALRLSKKLLCSACESVIELSPFPITKGARLERGEREEVSDQSKVCYTFFEEG